MCLFTVHLHSSYAVTGSEPNEPPVDEHPIHTSQQDSPLSSDALGETQDGQSVLQYQPKPLPVTQLLTPPSTPPRSECIC